MTIHEMSAETASRIFVTDSRVEDVVAELDAMSARDSEMAHARADELLLSFAPEPVQEALGRLIKRCPGWACA